MKRVLWFSNTQCGYEKITNNTDKPITGTWMTAIKDAFINQNEFELAIAFNYNKIVRKTEYKSVTYYPIYVKRQNNRFSRIISKAKVKISWHDEVKDYLEIIEDYKPDIIHVFGSENAYGIISKYTDIPVVLSIQGNLTVYEWKYFSGLSPKELFFTRNLVDILKFSTPQDSFKRFHKTAKRERSILKDIKYVIGRTDWDRRISTILAPNAKYYYNDEILRNEFYKMDSIKPLLKSKLVITTMTGPAVYKGFETICMAITLLNNLGINFVWNIGGISEGKLTVSVKKKLKHNFPKKNLNLLGRLDAKGIINLYRITNIYVMPSHIENSPLTLSEAMIMGLPIISTHAGGANSRLTDGQDGIMIQSGDPWSMCGAVLEMKSNYKKAVEYGVNARMRALIRHNPDKVINGLIKIYNKILKNN